MKLLARGKPIPGQSLDSGARLLRCDVIVEELTGCWINPHKHDEPFYTGSEEEVIQLTEKEGERFAEALANPPAPSPALVEAAEKSKASGGGDTPKSDPQKPKGKESS
jgi:hypothetical protein